MIYLFSRLNRYITRLFLKWYAICALGILTIITLFETIELFRRLMSRPLVTFGIAVEVLLLKVPAHLQLLMPLIALAATMITLWRLNQSSELTVMRASGISIWKVSSGIALASGLVGSLYLTVINPIQATLTSRWYFLEDRYFGTQHNSLTVNPSGIWLKDIREGDHHIFHAEHADLDKNTFHQVSLYVFDETGHHLKRYVAKEARLHQGTWKLHEVDIYTPNGMYSQNNESVPTHISLEKIRKHHTDPETLSFWQMPEHINMLNTAGLSSLPYRIYYEKQFAMIGMMIVMVLLGTAFCLRPIRFGRASFLVASGLGTGLIFHFLSDFSYALGLGERLPSLLAVFAPVGFGLLLSLILLLHIEEGRRTF